MNYENPKNLRTDKLELSSVNGLLSCLCLARRVGTVSSRSIVGVCIAFSLLFSLGGPQTACAQILNAKRGIADTGANYNLLQAVNAGWYYRWGPTKANIGNFDAEFVPMIWNAGQATQSAINTIIGYGDIEWVLGFNEPERPDQANLSVSQAITAWQTLSNGFNGTGIKLISPGVADTGGVDGGQAWLADFMNQANNQGLQVDAVAFHWYGVSNPNDPIGAANSFLSRVDSYHNSYGLPVWITEFALHDWGGNYTDEEMRNANAIFLDYVVPRLDSRSHVAGYSWYNWFGDSALVEGNPLTPTNVGEPYVGTLHGGDVEEIGGRDLGEHVAYMAGGELTVNTAAPTNFNYISALEGTSRVSGTADWGLHRNDWIRIYSGATLQKTGSNVLTLGIDLNNAGTLEVADGRIDLLGRIKGNGNISVTGGTLKLVGAGNIDSIPNVEIQAGGTLDVTGLLESFDVTSGQTLRVERNGTVAGNVLAGPGSTVAGAGTFSNNLTAVSGSNIRVGDAGLNTQTKFLVDDFSGDLSAYDETRILDANGGGSNSYAWDNSGGSLAIQTTSYDGIEQTALTRSDVTLGIGEEIQADYSPDDLNSQDIGLYVGAGTPATDVRADYVNIYVRNDGALYSRGFNSTSEFPLAGAGNVPIDSLFVARTSANTFELGYYSGETRNVVTTRTMSNLAVGNAIGFYSDVRASGTRGTLDNLWLLDPDSTLLSGETLEVLGDLTLEEGVILELGIYDPTVVDHISVGGLFTAAGALNVTTVAGASPFQSGDTFDLFNFSAATGSFDIYNLPSLSSGLAWNVSELLVSGAISVVVDVDLDDDGDVDGSDLLLIQQTDPALTSDWQSFYGSQLVSGTGFLAAAKAVPEPTTLISFITALMAVGLSRRKYECTGN